MKRFLRKTSILFGNVTYQSGDYSNNLHASDITIEVFGNRVVLSLDLSPNQPHGENSNSYLDAEELKRKSESLKPDKSDFWFYRKADSPEEVEVSRS